MQHGYKKHFEDHDYNGEGKVPTVVFFSDTKGMCLMKATFADSEQTTVHHKLHTMPLLLRELMISH